jgi:hypothetical protein
MEAANLMKKKVVVFFVLLAVSSLNADPVLHKFQLWGMSTKDQKLSLYWGWTNGFLQGRGAGAVDLANCLETMTTDQAMAMVDKHYKDHPERWSRPLGAEILIAVTVDGGPCAGKNVWK